MQNFSLDASKNFSDAELVALVNHGEYNYLQVLIDRYMPYVINTASKYNASGLDTEDFIQEGILAIFSAVKAFDMERASFKTFVYLCINRAMSSALLRVVGNAKHIPEGLISPIDDVEITDNNSPENILIEKESYSDLEHTLQNELSQFEYQVLCEFLNGNSYADIAHKLNVTEKSVDNALSRIRYKIKK